MSGQRTPSGDAAAHSAPLPPADRHVTIDKGHNRWHPDVPPGASVEQGEAVRVDFRDGFDGAIARSTRASDLASLDLDGAHAMTGPIWVEGAEPGDVLNVELLALETIDWGFTLIIPGFGMLGHRFTEPCIVHWDLSTGAARSADLPGVSIPAAPFIGLAGVAPSREQLTAWTAREAELEAEGHVVFMPHPPGAEPPAPAVAREGLRTIPPRENGGNMDVKQFRAGSTLRLPVEVPGALFSAGDVHFAQGDGESCGVAIETSGSAVLRFTVDKLADLRFRPRYPMFRFTEPDHMGRMRPYVATTGLPIDDSGANRALDTTLAAREALDQLVDYLIGEHGVSPEHAYVLVSVAGDLKISEIVDMPNVLVSAALPVDIFERDGSP